MKILNFVDMHGSVKVLSKIKEMAENADLIICAGDFSVWGRAQEAILRQFNSLKKPFIIIQGNHESDAEVNGFCKEFKNLNYAHKRLLNVGEFLIVGYGGGGFSERDKDFEDFIEEVKDELKDKKIIFVTHAPPYGTTLDELPKGHGGCKSFKEFLDKGIIIKTRRVGKSDMYKLNMDNETAKNFLKFAWFLTKQDLGIENKEVILA